jgi:hypothetical protein
LLRGGFSFFNAVCVVAAVVVCCIFFCCVVGKEDGGRGIYRSLSFYLLTTVHLFIYTLILHAAYAKVFLSKAAAAALAEEEKEEKQETDKYKNLLDDDTEPTNYLLDGIASDGAVPVAGNFAVVTLTPAAALAEGPSLRPTSAHSIMPSAGSSRPQSANPHTLAAPSLARPQSANPHSLGTSGRTSPTLTDTLSFSRTPSSLSLTSMSLGQVCFICEFEKKKSKFVSVCLLFLSYERALIYILHSVVFFPFQVARTPAVADYLR